MDCFHLELAIKAQVARPTPRRAIKKWVLFLGTLNAVVIGICPFLNAVFTLITHLDEAHHDTPDTATYVGTFSGRSH